MEQKKLLMTSSPHQHSREDTSRIMLEVLMALAPAATLAVFFFGWRALALMLVAVGVAVATEAVIQKLSGRPITIRDYSAAVTGLLLAFSVPAGLPLWMVAVGSAFAIAIGKHVFGGLGNNPFNPALVGRAVLLASWPAQMTTWVAPFTFLTTATPLGGGAKPAYGSLFLGAIPGSLGETSALALIIGGLYLLWRGIIDWYIPVGYIGAVAVFTLVFGGDPLFHVLAGGLLLGAFFMATDPVTSPMTKRGRLIMGIGCGLITSVIRLWGGYPEGVTYAILIMNALTPLIDRYVRPVRFGAASK
ncbi:MAG: RnfABCDGE type electron transport complex subunit D [Firmicutes bacterium]|nr:RnfABCDGE type electron transport complex subunit D [Bacillota bacterium]